MGFRGHRPRRAQRTAGIAELAREREQVINEIHQLTLAATTDDKHVCADSAGGVLVLRDRKAPVAL